MFVPEGPEEWVEVMQDIYERHFALLQDPDPDRVSEVFAEECDCWETSYGTVEFLADRDQHIEGEPTQVLVVKEEATAQELGLVSLTVKAHVDDLLRVDADGEVVQEISSDESEDGCVALSIRQDGPGDSWRIYSKLSLTGCPEG